MSLSAQHGMRTLTAIRFATSLPFIAATFDSSRSKRQIGWLLNHLVVIPETMNFWPSRLLPRQMFSSAAIRTC